MAQLYDARLDFSTNSNPNGVWTYGWSDGLSGTPVLLTRAHVPIVNNNMEEMWDDPANSAGYSPSVAHNAGGDYDNGNVTLQADALILHPCGLTGRAYAHVIWTAPKAGHYTVNGRFFAQQNGINVDVHVLVNGLPVFSATIVRNGVIRSFSHSVTFSAGETIAFSVGPNNVFDLHKGNTGLDARIEATGPEASIRLSEVEVCWPSLSNVVYEVECRSELTGGAWIPLVTNIVGNGETMCITDAIGHGQPQRLYRVVCPTP